MATERKHKRRGDRHDRRTYNRLYTAVCGLIILLAIAAGSMVFFKVHTVEVVGNERYSSQLLLESSGIQQGDNLLRIPRSRIESRMEAELPYLSTVKIRLKLPEGVAIEVVETEPAAAIAFGSSYWYIDCNGKVLGDVPENEGYPVVTGLTVMEMTAGSELVVDELEDLKFRGLKGLLRALVEDGSVQRVESIELATNSYLTMLYDGRLTVKMGLADDFHYDVKMLHAAQERYINDNWTEEDSGTLDMTKNTGEAVLSKN
ncbi:MAG: FtsQ-type POTRA domain-containing protein [Oscillospiraceae bacterium]|nr:FtsQ-type POTRA domain-containing protein [Oscillospiraceae bacterium]